MDDTPRTMLQRLADWLAGHKSNESYKIMSSHAVFVIQRTGGTLKKKKEAITS